MKNGENANKCYSREENFGFLTKKKIKNNETFLEYFFDIHKINFCVKKKSRVSITVLPKKIRIKLLLRESIRNLINKKNLDDKKSKMNFIKDILENKIKKNFCLKGKKKRKRKKKIKVKFFSVDKKNKINTFMKLSKSIRNSESFKLIKKNNLSKIRKNIILQSLNLNRKKSERIHFEKIQGSKKNENLPFISSTFLRNKIKIKKLLQEKKLLMKCKNIVSFKKIKNLINLKSYNIKE